MGDEAIRGGIMPPLEMDDSFQQLFESADFSKDILGMDGRYVHCLSTHPLHLCNYCGPLPTRKLCVIPIANR